MARNEKYNRNERFYNSLVENGMIKYDGDGSEQVEITRNCIMHDVSTSIYYMGEVHTEYGRGKVTDCRIGIEQNGNTIILEPADLTELEKIMKAKFVPR